MSMRQLDAPGSPSNAARLLVVIMPRLEASAADRRGQPEPLLGIQFTVAKEAEILQRELVAQQCGLALQASDHKTRTRHVELLQCVGGGRGGLDCTPFEREAFQCTLSLLYRTLCHRASQLQPPSDDANRILLDGAFPDLHQVPEYRSEFGHGICLIR